MNKSDTRALTPRPAVRTQLHEPSYWPDVQELYDEHRRRAGFERSQLLGRLLLVIAVALAVCAWAIWGWM